MYPSIKNKLKRKIQRKALYYGKEINRRRGYNISKHIHPIQKHLNKQKQKKKLTTK